jgi:hypothetical protein
MRYLFLGKVSACPDVKKIGNYAFHFADVNEKEEIDFLTQSNDDLLYGVDMSQLRLESYRVAKNSLEGIFVKNGIPSDLMRKWIPDSQYKTVKLSDEELRIFNGEILVEEIGNQERH